MSTTDDTTTDPALFEAATTDDLADMVLKQNRVSIKAVDGRDEFRLDDHESDYTIYFGGVGRRNSKWVFYAERGHTYTTVHTRRDYPPAVSAVLRRISDLSPTVSDDE